MTKKELANRARNIIANHKLPGTPGKETYTALSLEEINWLWFEVFRYHPDSKNLHREDIIAVTPKHHYEYGCYNVAFWVETKNAGAAFWSFNKCIKARPLNTLK